MKRMVRATLVALTLARAASAETAPAQGGENALGARPLTLEECVQIAATRNHDVKTSELGVTAEEAGRSGAARQLGPKVHVDGVIQWWDSSFIIPFQLPGSNAPPLPFPVREARTWTFSATAVQPLTGLWSIYDEYKVRDFGVDVARVQSDVAKRDVSFRVAEAYLRLLEASRLVEVARTSVTQLEAQLKQAQSLFDNGVIAKNDLLRAQLALASARQSVIMNEGQLTVAQGRLATAMGLRASAVVEPVPLPAGEPPPTDEPTVQSAESHAVERRIELREVAARTQEADARVALARKRLVPNVSAVANYTHFEGSQFQQMNAEYVGGSLSWDVWDWGANIKAIDEAAAHRDQAVIARLKLEDELTQEARQAYVGAETARAALAVARTAVEQAEENYRIVSRRFAAGEAKSFDVVDAEALLTQSRAQVESSLYTYQIARIALQRATGGMAPRVR